ncbi:MAG: CotH kinase family protein [Spirosomataceae bacterium]
MKKWAYAVFVLFFSCAKENINAPGTNGKRPEGWTEATHSNNVPPNYDQVFPDFQLNTITIRLGKENWQKISNDMTYRTARYFGGAVAANVTPPAGNGSLDAVPGDPIFIATNLEHNNKRWTNIGFRLKGNASLNGAWRSGNYKLPFKLKFDEFEDNYPEIHNQRFYGFKELSFAPCYGDDSFLKDKLVADLFRKGGVPACQTAFYRVYIDFGEGLKYCGIYTAVEVVEDTMVKTQYGDNKGNVYKPESNFLAFDYTKFEKQSNKATADYSDVQRVITTLNSPLRLTDPKKWKEELEAVFDVPLFLRWLAINQTIVNWDTYGVLTHNYYLYNRNGKISWIPYDLNLSMQFQGGSNNSRYALSLELSEVTDSWPLIKLLTKDPDYYAEYKNNIKAFLSTVFLPDAIANDIDNYQKLLKPYIVGPEGEVTKYTHLSNPNNFDAGVKKVRDHIYSRATAAGLFVSK